MNLSADADSRIAVDRPLGWLIALGGCIVIADQTVFRVGEFGLWAPWWNAGALTVAAAIIALAIGGRLLPMRLLGAAWAALPLLYAALQAAWVFAGRTSGPPAVAPWLWTLEPPVVAFLVLVLRPPAAVACSVLISMVPLLASLAVLGEVPPVIAHETPIQLANVGYVVVILGLRLALGQLHAAEQQLRAAQEHAATAAAMAAQSARLTRIVHDEVLSVLAVGMKVDGTPPAVLRDAAAQALDVLTRPHGEAGSPGPVPARAAADALSAALRGLDDQLAVTAQAGDGEVSGALVGIVTGAAGEAVRNSLRHAGPAARRRATVLVSADAIQVTVSDDGVGFDVSAETERLGVRGSIRSAMAEAGGSATIRSAPGAGTEVVLCWPA